MSGQANSIPSAFGFQCSVQEVAQSVPSVKVSEMGEMKELLRCQQEQLNRLAESITLLQNPHQRGHPRHSPWTGTLICRRCQQPGYFARECDGTCVTTCSHPLSNASLQPGGHPQPRSEN